MTSNHISKLSITGLRGVSQQLEINLEKPLTLIYGENGTGKTSICDAVDFLGNGVVGSISDISVGTGKHKYWPFIGSPASDINVYLELLDGQNWQAIATGKIANVTNVDTRPKVKVWRRKQLIDLILAKPADRFSVIKPFIDISEIEDSENKLRELKRQVDEEINSASIRISENAEIIARIRGVPEDSAQSDIDWARGQLAVSVEDVDDEIDSLDSIETQLNSFITKINELNLQKQATTQAVEDESQAKQAYDQVKNDFDEKVEETLDVLSAAQQYFHSHAEADECPVCLSKEKIQGLGESIDQKLSTLTEVQKAKNYFSQSSRSRESAENRLNVITGEANTLLQELTQTVNQLERFPQCYEVVSGITKIKNLELYDVEKLGEVKSQLVSRKTILQEGKGARDGLQAALNAYDEKMELQSQSSANQPIIDRLLEIHEEKRKAYVDGILSSIAGEVGRLYETIHPGEGLNQIALQLDPRRRASLEIKSVFLSQSVPPGAYFSNSHLDSLGLCVLIAIAKLEDPENTILVMDDILGSIDEPHVDRLVELLYAESQNFLHTLVTTHYQAWHFKIRRGQLRNANCQLIELAKWDSNSGVMVRDNGRSLLVILEQCIQDHPSEPEPIAANAGHLLEQLGDFIISRYACSVPKRISGNTLNDYLDALKPKFIQHLKVCIKQSDGSYIEIQLQPIVEELKDIYQVRNTTGAHYNELANHMPVSDILRFGELVVELGNALICPENGLPNKQKPGGYWSTADETRQLYPLVRP